MVQNFVHLST